MIKIDIKPMSVNEAWQGKRFKTKKYNQYQKDCLMLLPLFKMPLPPYKVTLIYGFSNKLSDIDNPTKQIVDILQKKYKFNDKDIYEMVLKKEIVSKGDEFIIIDIQHFKK
jgi:Holliday junction resolvase RusA-like endonuclease